MKHILIIIAQRLALGLLTLFAISLIITFGVELLPGDLAQAILGQNATPDAVRVFRLELGLDKPAHLRYLDSAGGDGNRRYGCLTVKQAPNFGIGGYASFEYTFSWWAFSLDCHSASINPRNPRCFVSQLILTIEQSMLSP